jgi:hypothetical protein
MKPPCPHSGGRLRSRLPLPRGRGSRPRMRGTSRVRRPRSALRAGRGTTGRKPLPVASGPGAASRAVREPNPSSRGSNCHAMSRCRTYRMPCRHNRSGTGFGPGDHSGQDGSSGSLTAHKSSSTIHGRVITPTRPIRSSQQSRPTRTVQQDPVTSSEQLTPVRLTSIPTARCEPLEMGCKRRLPAPDTGSLLAGGVPEVSPGAP